MTEVNECANIRKKRDSISLLPHIDGTIDISEKFDIIYMSVNKNIITDRRNFL